MTKVSEGYVTNRGVPNSGVNHIDSLIHGVKWGGEVGSGVTLTYSFPFSSLSMAYFAEDYSSKMENLADIFLGLTDGEMNAARDALELWSNVADIKFVEVPDTADDVGVIRFALSSALPSSAGAWAYYPSDFYPTGGDIWLNPDYFSGAEYEPGTYEFGTLLHEIGHALGLKHPFDGSTNLPTETDNLIYSIMSYDYPEKSIYAEGNANQYTTRYLDPSTPSIYDIAAIQYLYGPNLDYNSGDTLYQFIPNEAFFMTIWDGGGTDTIDASSFVDGVYISLEPGTLSSLFMPPPDYLISAGYDIDTLYDGTENLGIAFDCIIENATGGQGNDKIVGNKVANTLIGNAGDDVLVGGDGNDILNAGAGNDQVWAGAGDTGNDSLYGGIGDDILGGGAGNDVAYGGAGEDVVYGGSGNDKLFGESGKDVIWAGTGNDTIDGGTESDIIGGGQGSDRIFGGIGDDIIYASTEGDFLSGNAGNDTLFGGSGNDTLDGGTGNDELYGGAGTDVIIFGLNHGNDSIGGFETNGDNIIDLTALGLDGIDDLVINDTADGVLIDTGEGTIALWGVTLVEITSADFLF